MLNIKLRNICTHDPLSQDKFVDSLKSDITGVNDWKSEILDMDIL